MKNKMLQDFQTFMDSTQLKLRTHEQHHVLWVTIKELAEIAKMSESEIMQKVREFELDITSSVTSINSRVNEKVAEDFINYIAESRK